MSTGDLLRDWRKRWQELAVKRAEDAAVGLGLAVSTIYAWERGTIDVDPRDIRRAGVFFGATEAEISWALHLRSLPVAA